VVQWLRLCTSSVGGTGLIPGLGTKTPHALWHGQKKKNNTTWIFWIVFSPKSDIIFADSCNGKKWARDSEESFPNSEQVGNFQYSEVIRRR